MGLVLTDMQVTSSAFEHGGRIPTKHTAEGDNVSPALQWSDPPAETQSFAVICHDPDAPFIAPGVYGFVHWVLYNLPASTTSLEEGTSAGTTGPHDGGDAGYFGPLPPEGHGPHHYYFWVLALDSELDLEPGLTMWQLLERIEPHVLGMNRLMGVYERG